MMEVISIGAVLVGLLYVYAILFKRGGRTKSYVAMGGPRALASGLLAAMCWASFDAIDSEVVGLLIGAVCGIVAAVTAWQDGIVRMVMDSCYMALGLVGSANSVVQFATPHDGQQWKDVGLNLVVLALILIFAFWGFGSAFVRGRIPVSAALALFGVLEICLYLASPLGSSLLSSIPSVLGSLTVAVILGAWAAWKPDSDLLILVAGLSVGFCVLAAQFYGVSSNSVTSPWVATSILFGCAVPFFLMRGATKVVLGK
jgi:hypothetical protein